MKEEGKRLLSADLDGLCRGLGTTDARMQDCIHTSVVAIENRAEIVGLEFPLLAWYDLLSITYARHSIPNLSTN